MSVDYQPLIQHVKDTLIQQGVPSMVLDGGKRCRYRHGTLKCAIGVLIPDSHYRESMEDTDAIAVLENYPKAFQGTLKKFKITEVDDNLKQVFILLQQIHDFKDPSEWPEEFDNLSRTFSSD